VVDHEPDLVGEPTVVHHRLTLLFRLGLFHVANLPQILFQILDALMQLGLDLLVVTNIVRQRIVVL
jgi:hypothetical protein